MLKVKNGAAIANLSRKSLRANKSRNRTAVLAIALTTLLFTALFTIALTLLHSFQQETFRQVGGDMHGTFKDLTQTQMEELSDHPLIVKAGSRLILGMPTEIPFNKAHVEVGYMDETCARGYFCWPEQGRLPAEGTDEIACDTRILELLGVEPEIGARLTMTYNLGLGASRPTPVTDTFTLSGWWEYDEAGMASQAIVPRSYAESVLAGYSPLEENDQTGTWTTNVYLKSAAHIEDDLKTILADKGYQTDEMQTENYIAIGVNWAYLGAQLSSSMDPGVAAAIAALLALIAFTGYLVIYNVFQISVTNDIRFYGLLKTIGTTPRQIRRIIRRQALTLSALGVPLGLVLGYLVGNLLTPAVMNNLNYNKVYVTMNPLIFLGAAAFSLGTVLLSCRRPGRMAGKISPVEALRYTEGSGARKEKKGGNGGRVFFMAVSNLGRSRGKTVLVVLSLSLAVVLGNATFALAKGFDMEKYLSTFVVSDFVLGDASYFQTGKMFSAETALPEAAVSKIEAQPGFERGGRVYGSVGAEELVTEDWFRALKGHWNDAETLDRWIATRDRTPEGLISDGADLFGMEPFALERLNVLEGDLAPLRDPAQKAVAAVYVTDDYGKTQPDSAWAKLGDKVTIRYVDAWEVYDIDTGETVESAPPDMTGYAQRAKSYREEVYTVTALVDVPHPMSYRYYGSDQFVLGAERFKADSGQTDLLNYLCDVQDGAQDEMDAFLQDYTENVDPALDYESKMSQTDEFESFRGMFLLLGGVLSFIVGLVGVLNFGNAVLTSILTRRREFAVLQAVGMTGRQLKAMLIWEGMLYAVISLVVALVLSLAGGPLLGSGMESLLWFFTYRFSVAPVAWVTPFFLALGALMPLAAYRAVAQHTIVERLREAE